MKRSQMVTYLHNLINTYPGGTNFKRAQIVEILDNLQIMGMCPPEALFKADRSYICLCGRSESCRGCGGWLHEWEPEE